MGPMLDREESSRRRAGWLLSLGAAAGLVAAATSLLSDPEEGRLPEGSVARVNATLIRAETYQRLLAALASDRRSELSEEDRRHVLDRLIDEELLVQHGLALGLARSDRRVRADLFSAVIEGLVAEVEEREPDRAELEAFYRDEREYFVQTGRLWVRQIVVRVRPGDEGPAAERAREATRRRVVSWMVGPFVMSPS